MANLEKHLKQVSAQADLAEFSDVPTCGRSPRLLGHYIKNRKANEQGHVRPMEPKPKGIVLRLEDAPATPSNIHRMRDRIRVLNRRLAEAGTPIRLRLV